AKTYEHGGALWWALAATSGLITATYMGRLLFVTFFGEFRGTEAQRAHLHESPAVMTLPLLVLAVLSVVGGFLNTPHFLHLGGSEWLSHYLAPALARPATPEAHALDAQTEWLLMGITTVLALLVLVLAYTVYVVRRNLPVADSAMQPVARLLANKFYVDEIYDFLIVRPLEKLSKILHYYADIQAIDGLVNGVGSASQYLGAQFRKLQNGNIEYYQLAMVVGAALLVGSLFI
ncbi:MAG: NADH-quinone oxidoreductase subunit L, partial [Saprospiraceae bacterium]